MEGPGGEAVGKKEVQEASKEVQETSKEAQEAGKEVQEAGKEVQEAGKEVQKVRLLVEDGATWFQELRSRSQEQLTSPMDLFSLLLHSFLIELGFRGQELDQGWKGPRGHVSRLTLESGQASTEVVLTVTTLGPVVKVHGTHPAQKTSFASSRLQPQDFVTQTSGALQTTNLRQLARLFKDEVGVPLLSSARSCLGLPVTGLLGLPPELLQRLLLLLPLPSLLALSCSSPLLLASCSDPALWRRLFLGRFGRARFLFCSHSGDEMSWKERFRREQEAGRRRRQEQEAPLPPLYPFPDPSSHPGHLLPPPVPGMLGGDYDRFPGGLGLPPLFGGLQPLQPPFLLPRPRFDPPGPGFGGLPRPGGGFGGFM